MKPDTKQDTTVVRNDEDEQPILPVFRAEISNANVLWCGLKGILGKKDQHAVVEISEDSMAFTCTDQSKATQGCASISAKLFETYDVSDTEDVITFRLNLSTLIHCLGVMGTNSLQFTKLKVAYFDSHEVFSLQLNEGAMITECKVRTVYANETEEAKIEFASAFRESDVVNKAILPSEQLKDAFTELSELAQVATISLLMSPEYPYFQLKTQGEFGSCEIVFPLGVESFTQFECKETMTCTYRQSLLQYAGKALSLADKTCIRMNKDGMLSIQHMICQETGQKSYVDFFVLADCDVD